MVPEHTDRGFDADIDGMRSAVMTMGGLVERQVRRAGEAIRQNDLRLVTDVLADERVDNQLHVQVDLLCNQLIARRQPIAIDLREVMAAIHAVNDLERIGDEAKKIAYKVRHLDAYMRRDTLPLDKVQTMAGLVTSMLEQALDAFLRHDARASDDLVERDRAVDKLRDELNDELVARMSAEPGSVTAALDLVFVVQSLERIGDHAKNIAEYVVNVVEGIDARHAHSGESSVMPLR
jgi:phosphate transport system protein